MLYHIFRYAFFYFSNWQGSGIPRCNAPILQKIREEVHCLPFLCLFDLFCEVAILFWSLYSVRTAGTPTRYICIDKFVLVLTSEVNIQIHRS
jgi:hypothetical protein